MAVRACIRQQARRVGQRGVDGGGRGGGECERPWEGQIVAITRDCALEPVLLAESFDAHFLLQCDEGGVADEEFLLPLRLVAVNVLNCFTEF